MTKRQLVAGFKRGYDMQDAGKEQDGEALLIATEAKAKKHGYSDDDLAVLIRAGYWKR